MTFRAGWLACVVLLASAVACTANTNREAGTPSPSATAGSSATATSGASTAGPSPTRTPEASATASSTRTPTGTPTAGTPTASPPPGSSTRQDIRARRLTIPSLGIDSSVQLSQVVPDTSTPAPGCPAHTYTETFTVPSQGIVTPEGNLEGLENKAWVFGHSRWQGAPGILLSLQDISAGDEVLIDGVERRTGEAITRKRFIVDGIYLTDIESGGRLVTAASPAEIPAKPQVILQTSVREEGANRPWILNQQKVLAKSSNLVEGDINDPCKYLLLFVVARAL